MAGINPPFCTTDDVAGIWRTLRDDEVVRVENLIDDASAMILSYAVVAGRITTGHLTESTLRTVVKHMVYRVLINPTGLRQFSTTVDDATKSGTYDATVATGQLYLTAEELNWLLGIVPTGGQSKAFTITPWGSSDDVGVSYSSAASLANSPDWPTSRITPPWI